ncbi:hypothetical protein LX36DRAFT_165560 [Colletotrichum falcatum]|nr:hypothetical protein LX36DRAFT_165560 [Colletotrichum falcatum]
MPAPRPGQREPTRSVGRHRPSSLALGTWCEKIFCTPGQARPTDRERKKDLPPPCTHIPESEACACAHRPSEMPRPTLPCERFRREETYSCPGEETGGAWEDAFFRLVNVRPGGPRCSQSPPTSSRLSSLHRCRRCAAKLRAR